MLGALLDRVEEVHGKPETVCRKAVQSGDRGDLGLNLSPAQVNGLLGDKKALPDGFSLLGGGSLPDSIDVIPGGG